MAPLWSRIARITGELSGGADPAAS